jgi:phosphatidylglycerol lysyltransferase
MTIDAPLDAIPRVRELVLRYGWNATAYQIINPGIHHWLSAAGDAVAGYVEYAGVRVAAGAPVCAEERLPEVIREFEFEAGQNGRRVCYFGGESRLEAVCRKTRGYSMVLLGAQPAWSPASWEPMLAGHYSLRAQLSRSRNKGVTVHEWPPERATNHPALHECLHHWLKTRGLPPMHFLVEPATLTRLFDRRIFVAERAGKVLAFLVASPVPCRNGWLVEQIVRGHGSPNGTAELLIDAAVRAVGASGSGYLTLGLSPLSKRAEMKPDPNPPWVRILLGWAHAHGRRFYNFEGLDAFKAKFRPERWEPVYAIANERTFSPRMLYAIAAAFANGSPILMGCKGILRAISREIGWLARRLGLRRTEKV